MRNAADLVLDTTDWSVHDMRKAIFRELGDDGDESGNLVVKAAPVYTRRISKWLGISSFTTDSPRVG